MKKDERGEDEQFSLVEKKRMKKDGLIALVFFFGRKRKKDEQFSLVGGNRWTWLSLWSPILVKKDKKDGLISCRKRMKKDEQFSLVEDYCFFSCSGLTGLFISTSVQQIGPLRSPVVLV